MQTGMFAGKSFSIFDDGSIEIETGSGLQRFKDFTELRAAAAKNGHAPDEGSAAQPESSRPSS